jgi:hypothetical protein
MLITDYGRMKVEVNGRVEMRDIASIDEAKGLGHRYQPKLNDDEIICWVIGSTIPKILRKK